MKRESKSASNRTVILLPCLLFCLAACADVRGPTWLTGEPGDEVLKAPRAVATPPGAKDTTWPVLGDVPAQKPPISKAATRKGGVEELTSDKLQAQAEKERLRNIHVPEPFGVKGAVDPALDPAQDALESPLSPATSP